MFCAVSLPRKWSMRRSVLGEGIADDAIELARGGEISAEGFSIMTRAQLPSQAWFNPRLLRFFRIDSNWSGPAAR